MSSTWGPENAVPAFKILPPENMNLPLSIFRLIQLMVVQIIQGWAKTQTLGFTDQLNRGVRYFDLRVTRHQGDFYFTHTFLSGTVRNALVEVRRFAERHPKEVVLLDFNHFYKMRWTDDVLLYSMIVDVIGQHTVPEYQMLDTFSLKTAWKMKRSVIVFYRRKPCGAGVMPHVWADCRIVHSFPDTDSVPELMTKLEQQYDEGHSTDQFHVTQGVLTVQTDAVEKTAEKLSLRNWVSSELHPQLTKWLKNGVQIADPRDNGNRRTPNRGINIVSTDFVDEGDFVETVIALNRKGCIRKIEQDFFQILLRRHMLKLAARRGPG